jgi:transcriptional regulator with XRE-family HTH domain
LPQTSQKSPHPIDKHVGSRIRMRRALLGMTQQRLADSLSLTFQQVQKYEKGTNRVSASRLQQIATLLGVEVGFFYEGAGQVPGRDRAPSTASPLSWPRSAAPAKASA